MVSYDVQETAGKVLKEFIAAGTNNTTNKAIRILGSLRKKACMPYRSARILIWTMSCYSRRKDGKKRKKKRTNSQKVEKITERNDNLVLLQDDAMWVVLQSTHIYIKEVRKIINCSSLSTSRSWFRQRAAMILLVRICTLSGTRNWKATNKSPNITSRKRDLTLMYILFQIEVIK